MSAVTKPIVLDETFAAKIDAVNEMLLHQNAVLDVLTMDKRASLATDISAVAQLCRNGEILRVMDYGDQISPAWVNGENSYNPAMNLCHESDELLEDGETIHGAYFEWDKLTPDEMPFDECEAICYFDGTEGAGDHYITIGLGKSGWAWTAGQHIHFTLNVAPENGDQLVIELDKRANVNPTNNRTWKLYAKGKTTVKDTGTTSNSNTGTEIGSTNATNIDATNGKINAFPRAIEGYNRWSQSAIRQYLNSEKPVGTWWTPQNPWDRPPAVADTKDGFLFGYDANVRRYFKPIKVVTVACAADNYAEDITYDKVFLASLDQMYFGKAYNGDNGKEGHYWQYYKRILGATSVVTNTNINYPCLIKEGLDPTSAEYQFYQYYFIKKILKNWK